MSKAKPIDKIQKIVEKLTEACKSEEFSFSIIIVSEPDKDGNSDIKNDHVIRPAVRGFYNKKLIEILYKLTN